MVDFKDKKQVAKMIQYTNLNHDLTKEDILRHLEVTQKYDFEATLIAPCFITLARDVLKGTGIKVASVINWPLGSDTTAMKIAAFKELIKDGIQDIDFPANHGLILAGREKEYLEEMIRMVEVAHGSGVVIKTIHEFGYVTDPKMRARAIQLACEAGIDWVKSSSGWGKGGVPTTVEHVMLMKENVKPPTRVKAAGKVNSYQKAKELFEAGAELFGTSSGPEIMEGFEGDIEKY